MNSKLLNRARTVNRKLRYHLKGFDWMADDLCKKGLNKSRKQTKESTKPTDYPVDFVVTWVDESDTEWLIEKNNYFSRLQSGNKSSNTNCRYRDWGWFRYWFRAVEKYAPWVRYVWLVTYGHTPEWLDLDNPKLRVIRHDEFIPAEYLPTFSSRCIELNLWRIKELSEHFVYFNDDMYLFGENLKYDFFTGNLPNYCAIAEPLHAIDRMTSYEHSILNTLGLYNSQFNLREVMEEAPEKWFSVFYGNDAMINRTAYEFGFLSGIHFSHLPYPMRKSSMEACHHIFEQQFHNTCLGHFRKMEDINHQVYLLWELCHNTFEPVSIDHSGVFFNIRKDNLDRIRKVFESHSHTAAICLNDNELIPEEHFEELRDALTKLMESRFPDKSSYEK